MSMTVERRNQIAYVALKYVLKTGSGRHSGPSIVVDDSFRRHVGNIAKHTGLPFGEVLEFLTTLAGELLREVSQTERDPTDYELEGFGGH